MALMGNRFRGLPLFDLAKLYLDGAAGLLTGISFGLMCRGCGGRALLGWFGNTPGVGGPPQFGNIGSHGLQKFCLFPFRHSLGLFLKLLLHLCDGTMLLEKTDH